MTSNWGRQQNPRATAKKERAKQHALLVDDNKGIHTEIPGTVVWVGRAEYTVRRNGIDQSCVKAKELDQPVVGDVVYLKEDSIVGIMDRHSYLMRFRRDSTRRSGVGSEHILAANVQKAVIVASVAQPAFHRRSIDRYLIACQEGNITPIICLTKTDLPHEAPEGIGDYKKLGIKVIEISIIDQKGIHELREAIAQWTVVFIGASGAGKSSLVNAVLNGDVAKTGKVGEKTERGRHTTTATQLYQWMQGSYIIDTPGIRSFGVDHLEKQEIEYYFPEFDPYRWECKFTNCTHLTEPDCAVKNAVRGGKISRERYESYVRLMEE